MAVARTKAAKATAKKPAAAPKAKRNENQTRPTGASVDAFLKTLDDPQKAADSRTLIAIMREATGEPAKMWGPAIIGFGSVHYKYESGREGDMGLTGFSPRKQNLVVYLVTGYEKYDDLLAKLGTHSHGKSCLYLKRLADVDMPTLKALVARSVKDMRKKYGVSGRSKAA